MIVKPEEQDILDVLKNRVSGEMTFVIRNTLASIYCKNFKSKYRDLKTSSVRSVLQKMEKDGKVERVPSNYSVMICWRTTAEGAA